jgi:hypothetical protein
MQRARKYGPPIALAFGFVLTTVWAVGMAWIPLQLIASVISLMLSQIAL